MKTMAITEFKAHALRVLGEVARTRQSVVITKRGVPMAEVIPFPGVDDKPAAGRLAHTLVFEKDIVSPVCESDWSAAR